MFEFRASDYIQVAGFLVGGIVFVVIMKGEIKMLAKDIVLQGIRIDNQSIKIELLTVILKDQAVMSERVNALDKRLEDLRRGNGWITHPRDFLDGEYPQSR